MKKGLRHAPFRHKEKPHVSLNYCPDEEGIKTIRTSQLRPHEIPLNYCPDEEGIKTKHKNGVGAIIAL